MQSIIGISVGPCSVFDTYKLVCNTDNSECNLQFDNYYFLFNGSELSDFKIGQYQLKTTSAETNFIIANERIAQQAFIAFSYGISYFIQPLASPGIPYPEIQKNNSEFQFQKLSKAIAMIAMATLLFLLIISSAIFSFYNSKCETLEQQIALNSAKWEKYNIQEKRLQEQQELIKRNGLMGQSNLSFLSDQLTYNLPDDIYLRKLSLCPLSSADGRDFLFDNDRILIEGNCYSSNDLNKWISNLQSIAWIKKVNINEYKQSSSDDLGSFKIELIKGQL